MDASPTPDVFREHVEGLRRLARRLLRDDADADDVVQETLLLAIRRAPARILHLGPWLRGVVRKKASEARRSQKRRERRESSVTAREPAMDVCDVVARV